MRFFKRTKKTAGWLTISFRADGICVVGLKSNGQAKASVILAAFHPSTPAQWGDTLAGIYRDLRGSDYRYGTVLGTGDYQLLALDAPNVPREEWTTAVRWRLKDMLDFPVDEATVDVLELPADPSSGQRPHAMYAIAARNSVVQARQKLFEHAKLGLAVIDIAEMAQRNISALLEAPGRGLAMLSFGLDGGLLTVSFNGELYLSRRIDVTLAQLSEPDSDRQQLCFEKIGLELQRSLDHFDRQFHFISIPRLMLAPLDSPGLHEYLASNLDMPVEAMDLGDVLDLGAVPALQDTSEQMRFFLTMGAALRHVQVQP